MQSTTQKVTGRPSSATPGRFGTQGTAANKQNIQTIQEDIEESIDDIDEQIDLDDSTDNLTKAQIQKREAERKAVREYEARQVKQGRTAVDVEAEVEGTASPRADRLNLLWRKIRNFLTDSDDLGNKVELKRGQEPARVRFMKACQLLVDPQGTAQNILTFEKVRQAFVSSYLPQPPTDAEFKELFSALECWYNESQRIVNYSKILEAITTREKSCMYGIFPKIMQKPSSVADKITDNEKLLEQEKEAQRIQEEERRHLEMKDRHLDRIRRENMTKVGGVRGASPSKEDLKRQQREEALLKEEERLEKLERERKEQEEVKKEANEFLKRLTNVAGKFRESGSYDNAKNTLRMYDKTMSGQLHIDDFTRAMNQLKLRINQEEIQYLNEVIDFGKGNHIDYNNFCDILWDYKKIDRLALVADRRHQLGLDTGIDPKDAKAMQQQSRAVDRPSAQNSLGRVSGISDIMKKSEESFQEPKKFVDESEAFDNFRIIEQALLKKYHSFEEILQAMNQPPSPNNETKIFLKNFEKVVMATFGSGKFSPFQLKSVFQLHAQEQHRGIELAYITLRDFKDLYYPHRSWKSDFKMGVSDSKAMIDKHQMSLRNKEQDADENLSEASMLLDDIMQGRAIEDIMRERERQETALIIQEELRRQKVAAMKDDYETGSNFSERIDNIIAVKSSDPRQMKGDAVVKTAPQKGDKRKANAVKEHKVELPTKYGNKDFFRQQEVRSAFVPVTTEKGKQRQKEYMKVKSWDHAIDKIYVRFIEGLLADLHTAAGRAQPDYGSYVDRYGKEFPGHVTFNEVKEMYLTHVHFVDQQSRKQELPPDELLKGLFNLISKDQRNKISRDDFARVLETKEPPTFLERLSIRCKRGAGRLIHALRDECQDADIMYGANGMIPIPIFQTIMGDYDLPMNSKDKDHLSEQKFLVQDEQQNDLVLYKDIFNKVQPPKTLSVNQLTDGVIRIQKVIRGYLQRRYYKEMKRQKEETSEIKGVRDAYNDLKSGKKPATAKDKDTKKDKVAPKQKLTREEQEIEKKKKQEAQQKAQRQGRRENATLEKKMANVAKPQRNAKERERELLAEQELREYIRNTFVEEIITRAFCYGESLEVCRTIQSKYEQRPVTKFVYPLLQQFQFTSQGVSSKSLQAYNQLGQIMFLNSQNQLQQYDVATNRSLAPVSLGTRPPLKHYNIIDMVVDQRSGRIYTINSNWILEIWNIEQNASFPQKRIAVCTNEGGKDFISLYYENTFNDAKPRFLCLQESNQQVLVVNTTCVDGSLVFIDPISFSILKKIQLKYVDYELPHKIRQSAKRLIEVFDQIKSKTGHDAVSIFASFVAKNSQEINIKLLVNRLCELDPSLSREEMFETLYVMDEDNSGSVTMDEFLNFFGSTVQLEDDEYHRAQEEQLLQDKLWPKWVLDEAKLEEAQNVLHAMFHALERNHAISPEVAFGIYDSTEQGMCSKEEFRRIVTIFFDGAVPEGPKLDFVMRLALQAGESKIRYREFCKLLSKRFVRTFKLVSQKGIDDQKSKKTKSALETELERPTIKEATLSYILRKAAELQIDLRQEFTGHDPLDLSVISRVNFWGILISLPLGLVEQELNEIFDNDLFFDNNGNVDYVTILNSDIFVALERKRLAQKAILQAKSKSVMFKGQKITAEETKSETDVSASDNRKVVVEDLIFIDDLEIIIYTTVRPKTSTIFVTSMTKAQKPLRKDEDSGKVIDLKMIDPRHPDDAIQHAKQANQRAKQSEQEASVQSYPLIARLRGHKNDGAASIAYIPQSNCLVSAEKHVRGANDRSESKAQDPHQPPKTGYSDYSKKHQSSKMNCEILIWNLQRDMIELFTRNYPWNVAAHKKWVAHDASIIDICYMPKAQLLVTTALDQTIRFWDPVQSAYELTDPANNPHAQMKLGYYKPMPTEKTKTNATFKEVKRIYCGNGTNCYSLRSLCISGIILNQKQPEIKSQIEWLVCLKNPPDTSIKLGQTTNQRIGIVCGYGIERVKIEIPARHIDDVVPTYITRECEEMVEQRRRKIVTAFQKHLPSTIEKIYSQAQLQNSYMEKIRKLFMQAILNRKDDKFVNPIPLREVYKIILKLPARTKFESFLASSGCNDKLSVSETFFYLQRFMQIHPLRTTQIEFEKSIEDFYNRHQRQYLQGIKKWPKAAIQKFSNYIRLNGLDTNFLQEQSKNTREFQTSNFVTRERFQEYFFQINERRELQRFEDDEIESIMNELDPYSTGVLQIKLVEKYFREEIEFFKQVSLRRPHEIIEKIRSAAFPNKKVQLQQSLAAADQYGDGYITKLQFVDAIYRAGLKIERDQLDLLFDVMSERFDNPKSQTAADNDDKPIVKYLNLPYFFSKLFTKSEVMSMSEVDQTLQSIKAALIYKGVDFGIIFAEQQSEETKPTKRSHAHQSKADEQKLDLMCHYSRFAQQIVHSEFCERVAQLNAQGLNPDKITRLANYLTLNQKNQKVIYLNTWLHHLRRINTQFQVPDKSVLPIICSKLLKNESIFKSLVESIGLIKQNREEEKFVELADLRQVLRKFGISYINQGLFLQQFTKGTSVHLQDLIARMKACVKSHYNTATSDLNEQAGANKVVTLADLKNTDYFELIQRQLKKAKAEVPLGTLLSRCQEFDDSETGMIQAYKLVNILKHQLPGVFREETLIGLQYELECLSYEQTVDYSEFIKIFLSGGGQSKKLNAVGEIKLELKKSAYTYGDYEDLIGQINQHVKTEGLDLMHIFEIFCKRSGFISYQDLRKIIDLIGFQITDKQFELLTMHADDGNQQNIHAYDLASQIVNAELVTPQFDIQRWIIASRELQGRHNLLALVHEYLPSIKDQIQKEFSAGKANYEPTVMTGLQFSQIIRKEVTQMSEHDIDLLTVYSIRGSRRQAQTGEHVSAPINIQSDLIQIQHFEKALQEVVNEMRRDENKRRQKEEARFVSEAPQDGITQVLKNVEELAAKKELEKLGPEAIKRQDMLIQKVVNLFREREVSFFDAFQSVYDPLLEKNIIPIKQFKDLVNRLNLPLTVQDQRIMRRIADPNGIGKVDLNPFCRRFETHDLRINRLNRTLDKVATAFYVQNFNLKKAFQLFDVNGDGVLSKQELRQGFATLEIGITYDEINDLMGIIQTRSDGKISYDDFIAKMDTNLRQRRNTISQFVEEEIYAKIAQCLQQSGESLYQAMKIYDNDGENKIQARDLTRVFKRLGLQSIEPHLPLICKIGDIRLQDQVIEITDFVNKFTAELERRTKQTSMVKMQVINKLNSLLHTLNISIFDFFVQLDTNRSGKVSRVELVTGLANFGLVLLQEETKMLWSMLHKPQKKVNIQQPGNKQINDPLKPREPEISYYDLMTCFIQNGIVKFNKTTDKADILIGKYRQQMKRLNLTVDKLYKVYDPKDVRFVFKHDFVDTSLLLGFEFSDEELEKIFEHFCQQGATEDNSRAGSRFSQKQMTDALLAQKDTNWIFNAYIKIHSIVLQKNFTYKKLFSQWKTNKQQGCKLTAPEIVAGLKKLKAGLTTDEIEKLAAQLKYDGKEMSISDKEFEQTIIEGAEKLANKQAYERMLLADWIKQFNEQMERKLVPIDNIFADCDSQQEGSLSFQDFTTMNDKLEVMMPRKKLHQIFDVIDRQKNKRIRLEDLKNLSQFTQYQDENALNRKPEWEIEELNLQGEELMHRHKTNECYEEIKNKIEAKNTTLEHIIFTELKFDQMGFANTIGLKQILEKLSIVINNVEAQRILADVRKFNHDKFECTYKNVVDFMNRKRINAAAADKGFIDPLKANTVQAITRVRDQYDFTNDHLFRMFDVSGQGYFTKEQLSICTQGMKLPVAPEDVLELFNEMDEQNINRVTKKQFNHTITLISSKMGGPSVLEQTMVKKQDQARKGVTNLQQIFAIMQQLSNAVDRRRLSIKQLHLCMDINKTGYLSRAEFAQVVHNIDENVSLENIRLVMQYLDDKATGKVSINEFLRIVLEILNQQIGGGIYAFMQVQPIIQRIINELAIDCDRFFDEVADMNQAWYDQQAKVDKNFAGTNAQFQRVGLNKSIFMQTLNKYGVTLSEKETALISSVFSLNSTSRENLDYSKIDAAFEGMQQQLYAQESQFTVQWERRIFKMIGQHLMQMNVSIHECFQMIDTDDSRTISLNELEYAITRFDLGLNNKQIKAFLARLDPHRTNYITQQEFIQRFWSAYTYDDVFEDDSTEREEANPSSLSHVQMPTTQASMTSHNINAANLKIKSELDTKVQSFRMFKAVQKQLKETKNVQETFTLLDTNNVGFLTLRDFQINLSKHFSLSLKAKEVRQLFQEIDTDQNGIIKFAELDAYFNCNYSERVDLVKRERQDRCMQNEIFDHLIKVLKQRGMTLSHVFQEIDDNCNNFIEVDEMHDLLERMGFTITQEQCFELMRSMDENFDGRISYDELKGHLIRLGFDSNDLEDSPQSTIDGLPKKLALKNQVAVKEHRWRDKALELIIRTVNSRLKDKPMHDYFSEFDGDHDGHLAPVEFRKALLALKEPMLKLTQIERIMHVLIEERLVKPKVPIDRICKLLGNYKFIQLNDGTPGNSAVLIDEDLFVYIVEKYDGISRMMEFVGTLEDKSTYMQRHIYELGMRGLNMMSNQKQVLTLTKKSATLSELYQSTLVLLAGDITRLIKEEAILAALDPSKNINTIISDQNVGVLSSVSLPTIENSQFDVDYTSIVQLPCGAQCYRGMLMQTREPIEILLYPSDNLQYVSLDGKPYKRHLATELQIHRYLMGARFEEDDEMINPGAFQDDKLDIFANIGKFEKKIGLSVNDKEIYVINKQINEDEWICVDDFVMKNGGILNIPLFYHTEAPLYIIRHWAKLILKIIAKVHDVSVVLRSLSTKQLWISRDGQRIRLGHVRGAGRVNNLGFLKSCPDIYLNLENNDKNARDDKQSTGFSPSKAGGQGGFASSRKTNQNDQTRVFSNKALDSSFIAPEVLFQKFSDHTAAMDVWSFGMVMFSVLFGRKPVSYYQVYKQWLLKAHQTDTEMGTLPFIPPSNANFIYDPFSIDFENPFDSVNIEDLAAHNFKQKMSFEDVEDQFRGKDGSLNFDNFMKCISDLSYSGMFTAENSKKFNFPRIVEPDQKPKEVKSDDPFKLNREEEESNEAANTVPIKFAGQKPTQDSIRKTFLMQMAKSQLLQRKNELGLILDLIAGCLDVDPKKRPTIQGLLNSPIFQLDTHERTNAVRFSQNVILYRSPIACVSVQVTHPLRQICAEALKSPMGVYDHTENILKLFARVEDAIQFNTSLPIDELNEVMTEAEKRKGKTRAMIERRGVDSSKLRVSPNSPLAAQVVEDKVIDMLLFLTFRYIKNFQVWKQKQIQLTEQRIQMVVQNEMQEHRSKEDASETHATTANKSTRSRASSQLVNQHEEVKKNMKRLENQVLQRMTHLLKTVVYQMHSYNTPMAPHVNEVIQYIVKFFIGEEHIFGSDSVLFRTCQNNAEQLRIFLRERSFFRRDCELDANFKSDQTDKLWFLEQKNKTFLDKSNYWCPELYNEALKIYRDAITESGRGQSCYPVICDFITSVTNNFEPTKIFSKQMSHLSMSFLIPMHRTSAYYNELIPIAESLSRLYNPDLEKAGKRCSLAMVRSVFQTGNSDKIKACLDMRVPKHLVHFIQDTDQEVRRECLYTYLEISKGLQDDDFEVIGKHAANLKREFSKQGFTKTAFDLHKAVSMASQSEVLDAQAKIDKINATNRRGTQARQQAQVQEPSQTEAQCNYIRRTIALIEKNENEKYINFALDLPNLNFLASKRFLREMAICFESPVFIAPIVRLMKTPSELYQNKLIILDIFRNLVCGNERVLIALNSPACDTYMTLLKLLMMNTKMQNARQNPHSGISTQMKQTLALQDRTIELFEYMFEQRRPTIIRDISCIGASATLLREQNLPIPLPIKLPDVMAFFDALADIPQITPKHIKIEEFIGYLKDLRCWVKHFFAVSTIPELTRIKAMQRAVNLIIRVLKVVWREYFRSDDDGQEPPEETAKTQLANSSAAKDREAELAQQKLDYMQLIRLCLSFFDWLCVNDRFLFIFNEESGACNLAFIINTCNMILSQFRKPKASTICAQGTAMPPMEELTFDDRANQKVQEKRKYDIFPFTDIGSILQNIQYQLVKKNDPFLNTLLSEANFGFVFGEQLLLDFDFIRHCIDNCVESLVLMDSYVKKNEIRLNTFEFILRSSEATIKDQLIKSNFCERMFLDYVRDFREFNIQFSKIDLEFLAFRRSYPLRLEAISMINTTLMLKEQAPQIFNEFLMYSRRHFLVREELKMLQTSMAVKSKEATCLLLFAILLESNESDLIYVMVQEGAHKVIRGLMQEQPSLNKRFPILREFINKF